MSTSSSVSSDHSVRRCAACGSFLSKWQTHDVCVLHYGEDCGRGGTCTICCLWSDAEWCRSDSSRERRLQRIKEAAIKRDQAKAAKKGKVKAAKSKSVAHKGKPSTTPSVDPVGHSFFLELDELAREKRARKSQKGVAKVKDSLSVLGDYPLLLGNGLYDTFKIAIMYVIFMLFFPVNVFSQCMVTHVFYVQCNLLGKSHVR